MNTFNDLKLDLSELDIKSIVDLVGYRCSHKTKKRIESKLRYSSSGIKFFGILERLVKENDSWAYIAGQSYVDEIRLVRGLILNNN